jgi:biopolymer transport protein ExbD
LLEIDVNPDADVRHPRQGAGTGEERRHAEDRLRPAAISQAKLYRLPLTSRETPPSGGVFLCLSQAVANRVLEDLDCFKPRTDLANVVNPGVAWIPAFGVRGVPATGSDPARGVHPSDHRRGTHGDFHVCRRYRRGSAGRMMAEMNITPLVDVMLVLLIIFMVAAPLATRQLDLRLPQNTPSQPNTIKPPHLSLSILGDGQFALDGAVLSEQALGAALSAASRRAPNTIVDVTVSEACGLPGVHHRSGDDPA